MFRSLELRWRNFDLIVAQSCYSTVIGITVVQLKKLSYSWWSENALDEVPWKSRTVTDFEKRVLSLKYLLTNITFLSCVWSCAHSLIGLSPYPAFRLWCIITWTLWDVHVDCVVACSVGVVLKSWYEGRSESLLCIYFGLFTFSSQKCRLISGFRRDGTDRLSLNIGMERPLLAAK
jgi:hypothetical protein